MMIDYWNRKTLGSRCAEAQGLLKEAWHRQAIHLSCLPDELPPEDLKEIDDFLRKAMGVIRRARKELHTLN